MATLGTLVHGSVVIVELSLSTSSRAGLLMLDIKWRKISYQATNELIWQLQQTLIFGTLVKFEIFVQPAKFALIVST